MLFRPALIIFFILLSCTEGSLVAFVFFATVSAQLVAFEKDILRDVLVELGVPTLLAANILTYEAESCPRPGCCIGILFHDQKRCWKSEKKWTKHGENLWNTSVMSSHRAVCKYFTKFLFDLGFPAFRSPFQTFTRLLIVRMQLYMNSQCFVLSD